MKYLLLMALVLHVSLAQISETKYGFACEGGTIPLQCAAGEVIRIVNTFYGRTDGVTCPDSAMKNRNCVSQSALIIVINSCKDKRSCSVLASDAVFGNPCVGTSKYTEISYKCVVSDIQTAVSCDAQSIHLSCPPGKVLEIVKANYGRTDAVTCPQPRLSNTNCQAPGVTTRIAESCNCRSACSVSPNIFGDPCFGTSKYLDIQYHCISLNACLQGCNQVDSCRKRD